ncbi:hypothetical protein [Roseomonas indoligenes]|uniref:Uncharacterized protein n=1 Tax=Roseomonas indoligenes TaxID=2820811 RepID=A0A940MX68_9PROT|nr:hypothetical protein [Pararoseomonas indoligenes]MBP0492136.1 hypothetical protein [Pararoseomonas indoligenes]
MAHHKRGRARNRRACCKMCKGWKVNGHGKDRVEAEAIGSFRRRLGARLDMREAMRCA